MYSPFLTLLIVFAKEQQKSMIAGAFFTATSRAHAQVVHDTHLISSDKSRSLVGMT